MAKIDLIQGFSLTVLYPSGKSNNEASEFCEEKNWRYHSMESIYGLEDEAVIVLDMDSMHLSSLEPIPTDTWKHLKPGLVDIVPEFVSRANSRLIMITSVNNNER